MQFGWKILIPVSILWILVVATLRTLSLQGAPRVVVVGFASFVVLLVMAANIGFDNAKKKKLESLEVEVSEPSFAVPTVPMNVSNINVSQSSKGGDHV
jgi:NADH-quinone oxidoreductase subunit H